MEFMKLNIQLFASGTITFEPSGKLQGKLEWTSTGDIPTNTSYVTVSLFARRIDSYTTTGKQWSGTINIGDYQDYFSSLASTTSISSEWVRLRTYTQPITHNSDGTKSILLSGSVKGPSGTALANNISSGSETVILDRLHKSPEISITSITETNANLVGVANNTFIQYLSQKQFVLSILPYDSATVSDITISNGDTIVNNTSSPLTLDFTNKTLYIVDNKIPIKITVSDSLQAVSEKTEYYSNYIPYVKPAIIPTSTTTKRNGQISGKVLLNLEGTFYNATIGSVVNAITVKYHFWEKGTTEPSSWITIPSQYVTVNNNDVSVYNYEIGSDDTSASNYFDFEKAYDIKIKIEDAFEEDYTVKSVAVGEPLWSEYKDRVDFKKITIKGEEITLPKVLYNNPSGSNSDVVLNDNVSNYKYLEIFYITNDNDAPQCSIRIDTNVSLTAVLMSAYAYGYGSSWLKIRQIKIVNDNTITNYSADSFSEITLNNNVSLSNLNSIYITKVIGYY